MPAAIEKLKKIKTAYSWLLRKVVHLIKSKRSVTYIIKFKAKYLWILFKGFLYNYML